MNRSVFLINKKKYSRAKMGNLQSSTKRTVGKIVLIVFITFFVVGIVTVAVWMRVNVFEGLPDVTQVKDMQFQQATIIQDRNGVELYKLFEENREYVELNPSLTGHKNMINAIVAIEDQRYREHEGLDPWGILRAAIKRTGGASTLPQQLMTNIFNLKGDISGAPYGSLKYYEERVKYKLRQIVLSKRLNTVLSNQIKEEHPSFSSEEIKHEMKLKTLEMYLNYIELGNNAFGIESASKTYFGHSASDLTILEASIIASLPKSPTKYNPLKEEGRKSVLGYFSITDTEGKEYPYESTLKNDIITKFSSALDQANFSDKTNSNAVINYLLGLGSFTVSSEGKTYIVKYLNGRKDVVLARMFEDQYIDAKELSEALKQSLNLSFQSSVFKIKAPHFVFWIKSLLEKKYGSDASTKGLIVRTTLDYTIQQEAEQVLKNNERELFSNGASNSAMLYINTNSGDVLAYVGSLDYFNDDIDGQVDMIRTKRQSGSSIKPLLYALGFMRLPLTIDTPIYDLPFNVGGKTPHNADGKYEGLLPLKMALGHSRNIPSIKMFLALGGENAVKPFFQSLGLTNILNGESYGYSLSLGAAEVPMLELASAYSHLTTETPAEIDPILSITTNDGSLIYQKQVVEKEEKIPLGIKFLIWKILSDPQNRIVGWINKFNVAKVKYALKTGTSNVVTGGVSRPRDGWIAAYVPEHLVLMRAGNANAAPMYANAYGGTIHAEPLKTFLRFLSDGYNNATEKDNYIPGDKDIAVGQQFEYLISKISGKQVSSTTPLELQVKTVGYNNPTETEGPIDEISYDASCLGMVSPMSALEDIKQGFLVQELSSFMPNQEDITSIIKYFEESAKKTGEWKSVVLSPLKILTETPSAYCEGKTPIHDDNIQISFLSPVDHQKISLQPELFVNLTSENFLENYKVYFDGTEILSHTYPNLVSKDTVNLNLNLSGFGEGNHDLTFEVITLNGGINSSTLQVQVQLEDKTPPYWNREKSKISYNNGTYEAWMLFGDELSSVMGGKIEVNGKMLTGFYGNVINFSTSDPQIHVLIQDAFGNILHQDIDLSDA